MPLDEKRLRLLILCTSQFGYHLDTYYYCKHGWENLDITYMGFEGTRPLMTLEGICVKPVSYRGNKVARFLRWCGAAMRESRRNYDVVFVKYFPGCSLLRLLAPRRGFICDIRTGSIKRSRWRRHLADRLMVLESRLFRNVTVISERLARKLKLRPGSYQVLPLGADVLADNDKRFDALHLLYVGTLSGREIEKTIQGFAKFYRRHQGEIEISYTIAGDGYRGELDRLKKLAGELGLEKVVTFLGFVNHADLAPYWRNCNVGVSFVPINEIYDCQPATKTFEYLLSGMPVIATDTSENRRVVNATKGVLIDDTADAFEQGLDLLCRNKDKYRSERVRDDVRRYAWKGIVSESLIPCLSGTKKEQD